MAQAGGALSCVRGLVRLYRVEPVAVCGFLAGARIVARRRSGTVCGGVVRDPVPELPADREETFPSGRFFPSAHFFRPVFFLSGRATWGNSRLLTTRR